MLGCKRFCRSIRQIRQQRSGESAVHLEVVLRRNQSARRHPHRKTVPHPSRCGRTWANRQRLRSSKRTTRNVVTLGVLGQCWKLKFWRHRCYWLTSFSSLRVLLQLRPADLASRVTKTPVTGPPFWNVAKNLLGFESSTLESGCTLRLCAGYQSEEDAKSTAFPGYGAS